MSASRVRLRPTADREEQSAFVSKVPIHSLLRSGLLGCQRFRNGLRSSISGPVSFWNLVRVGLRMTVGGPSSGGNWRRESDSNLRCPPQTINPAQPADQWFELAQIWAAKLFHSLPQSARKYVTADRL